MAQEYIFNVTEFAQRVRGLKGKGKFKRALECLETAIADPIPKRRIHRPYKIVGNEMQIREIKLWLEIKVYGRRVILPVASVERSAVAAMQLQ